MLYLLMAVVLYELYYYVMSFFLVVLYIYIYIYIYAYYMISSLYSAPSGASLRTWHCIIIWHMAYMQPLCLLDILIYILFIMMVCIN